MTIGMQLQDKVTNSVLVDRPHCLVLREVELRKWHLRLIGGHSNSNAATLTIARLSGSEHKSYNTHIALDGIVLIATSILGRKALPNAKIRLRNGMAKLRKKVFWDFVVSLPEKGDVVGMQNLLDQYPEHRAELLYGTRPGVDQGEYSVLRYATWLCQFADYRSAKEVVRWLVGIGIPANVWTALALEDEAAFRAAVEADPSLVEARHPLFQQRILEMASDQFRQILIESGADVSSIFDRVLLGDINGARKIINEADFAVDGGQETTDLLMHAIVCQQDDFACCLLDRGASPSGGDGDGYTPIMMACVWGCAGALRALLAQGVDPTVPVLGQSLLTWTVHRCVPRVEIVDLLLNAGVAIPAGRFEGQTLVQAARKRGLDDIVERLVEARKTE